MQANDIASILGSVVAMHPRKGVLPLEKEKIPAYYPTYPLVVDMAGRIAVHAEEDTFPDRLFKAKAPNEDDAQWEYRKANYRPKTKPFWNRAVGAHNRIWNEQNYELKWPEEAKTEAGGDVPYDYFYKEYPQHKALISYFQKVVTRLKLNDPNAVLCVKPLPLPMVEVEIEGLKELRPDDTQKVRPIAHIYRCPRVVAFLEGEYCLIETPEKSVYQDGKDTRKDGLIYEFYDRYTFWRIVQVRKIQDKREAEAFDYIPELSHQMGFMPCWKLGGLPLEHEGENYFKSPLFDALPDLDEALYDASNLAISKASAVFPQRWVISEPCNTCLGNGYVIEGDGEDAHRESCKACGGTGHIKFDRTSVIHVKPQSGTDERPMITPPFGFVEPGIETLKFTDEQIDKQIRRAFVMVNIDVSMDTPHGDETATGQLIDREELFSHLLRFAQETFDLLSMTIKAMLRYRYAEFRADGTASFDVADKLMPEVSAPTSFEIRNEADLTEEIAKANESGLPSTARRLLSQEYIGIRFSNDAESRAIVGLIYQVDSLADMQQTDIDNGVLQGTIPKWRAILHINIESYIDEILEEQPDFLSLPLKDQKARLRAMAEAEVPQATTRPSVDDMINRLNNDAGGTDTGEAGQA